MPDIRLRFFASAREAVGVDETVVVLAEGATIGDALATLVAAADQPLDRVLSRCSFLVDGVASTDRDLRLDHANTLDVLPPFAGG